LVNSRSSSAARSAAATASPLALLERHRVVGRQPVGPPHFGRGAIARGGRLRQLRAQPFDLCEERTIVELKEQLSRPDEAALVEGHV
jgi:hypothetical protein